MNFSKTRYCRGVQCPKMLWMDIYKPEEADNSIMNESVLAAGNEVGETAKGYFGNYEDVPYSSDKREMADKTKSLMDEGAKIICEASFIYSNNFCSVDILRILPDGAEIYEVKSSTEFKDVYADDTAYQLYVLKGCGIKVKKVCLMHINKEYVRQGKLDLQELFKIIDCTEICLEKQKEVSENLKRLSDYISGKDEPEKDISENCFSPYGCIYWSYCTRHIERPSVFEIRSMKKNKKFQYYNSGIITYGDLIKNNIPLSENQSRQVMTEYNDLPPKIEVQPIRDFLKTLSYPLYYLDFETYMQAVPLYDGMSPYKQIPFQYSLHIEKSEGGEIKHREFLGKEGTDTRRSLAESLVNDIPMGVCSIAYNMKFEKMIIKALADIYPDLEEHLLDIFNNMHDLMIPFQRKNYYAKELEGSYSIKYVLPSICPDDKELDYNALEGVHNGEEAMNAFANLHKKTPEEIKIIRQNLLAYCRLDTLAMVKIVEKLRRI